MKSTFPLAILFMVIACAYGDLPVQATEVRLCDNKTNYPFQLNNIKLRIKDGGQEIKMKIVLRKDVDDDANFVVGVDKYVGSKLKRILTLKKNAPCTALTKYGGETFMNGVKQAKFPHPDRCPLEKGTYNLDWYRINFETIPAINLVPKGKFQLTVQSTDTQTGKDLICVVVNFQKN